MEKTAKLLSQRLNADVADLIMKYVHERVAAEHVAADIIKKYLRNHLVRQWRQYQDYLADVRSCYRLCWS